MSRRPFDEQNNSQGRQIVRGASSCLPVPGLVGQEMALSDYLKHIRASSVGCPRRSSARGGRRSQTTSSDDGKSYSLHEASSAKMVEAIRADGGEAISIACDATMDRTSLERACTEVLNSFGHIDIW